MKLLTMLINNVRRGFATNSSSSHSLVYFYNPIHSADEKVTGIYGGGEYGWDQFELTTLAEKLQYGLVNLIGENHWTTEPDPETVEDNYNKYGHLFPEFSKQDFESAMHGYVDHQSRDGVDRNNPEEFINKLRDPHVAVYGGNDNGELPFDDDENYNIIPPAGASKIEFI